jgi:hypothetical protein
MKYLRCWFTCSSNVASRPEVIVKWKHFLPLKFWALQKGSVPVNKRLVYGITCIDCDKILREGFIKARNCTVSCIAGPLHSSDFLKKDGGVCCTSVTVWPGTSVPTGSVHRIYFTVLFILNKIIYKIICNHITYTRATFKEHFKIYSCIFLKQEYDVILLSSF